MSAEPAIQRVAVVGSGLVGSSWSLVFSRAGRETRVYDVEPRQLASLHDRLRVHLEQWERWGAVTADEAAEMLERIEPCAELEDAVAGADYVQESIPEDLAAKQALFAELDRLTPSSVILGSSVAVYPMSQVASRVQDADRCIVVHPTNPPHLIPLVEIVPAPFTRPDVVQRIHAFMTALGQEPIVCRKEMFGFVLNRLQYAVLREAAYLATEGVASVEDIDKCVSAGLGLRWAMLGPLETEVTNSPDFERDWLDYNDLVRDLFDAVCQPYDGPTAEHVHLLARGVREAWRGRSLEEMVSDRNAMVMKIQALKGAGE
jgi:L-gulonate 3-dehydrogenase